MVFLFFNSLCFEGMYVYVTKEDNIFRSTLKLSLCAFLPTPKADYDIQRRPHYELKLLLKDCNVYINIFFFEKGRSA